MTPLSASTDRHHRVAPRAGLRRLAVLLIAGLVALVSSTDTAVAQPQSILPVVSEGAIMEDKLGAVADLDIEVLDEAGQKVRLGDLVSGERPVVLNLGYFSCPSVCGPILIRLADCMTNASLTPGEQMDILSVSIKPGESPELGAAKRKAFLEKLALPAEKAAQAAASWRFVTGEDAAIRKLADSVGYRYETIEHNGEIDHPPVVVLLSPSGVVTRYLKGETMEPVTLERALIEAGEGTVGSFLDRLLVSCLTYDSSTGVYSMTAMTVMQVGGALTVLALAIMIFVLLRRERVKPTAVVAH